jgi:hypothetical protein
MVWKAQLERVGFKNVSKFPQKEKIDVDDYPEPLSFHPDSGVLTDESVTVEIVFAPKVPQHEVLYNLNIASDEYAVDVVTIKGIGASAKLIRSKDKIRLWIFSSRNDCEFSH